MKSWNDWRATYNQMSYADQKQFYNEAEEQYPVQIHFAGIVTNTLIQLQAPLKLMEIGGWKGHLAAAVLAKNPAIQCWDNYEICENCIPKIVCLDPRYRCIVPTDFVWNLALPSYDLVVSTHTFEHLQAAEIEAIITRHPAQTYLIEMPHSASWNNYNGCHICPLTREELNAMFERHGYRLQWQERDVRYFVQEDVK